MAIKLLGFLLLLTNSAYPAHNLCSLCLTHFENYSKSHSESDSERNSESHWESHSNSHSERYSESQL